MALYCPKCGKKNEEESIYCIYCGKQMKEEIKEEPKNEIEVKPETETDAPTQKTNGLAVAGFVIGLVSLLLNFWGIVGIVATVLSAVGLSQIKARGEGGKGLAVTGLILGILGIVWGFFTIILTAIIGSIA